MKKKTVKYTHNPDIGELMMVKEELPSPQELAEAEEVVTVSIAMSRKSIEFFKKSAKKTDLSYTGMIRRLVDTYVERFQHP